MANVISYFGAQDFIHQNSARMENYESFWIASSDATPIFNGDFVQRSAITPVSGGYGNYITQGCSATAYWVGLMRGCKYYSAAANKMIDSTWWPGTGATGDIKVYIQTDTQARYLIQASSGGILGSSEVGGLISIMVNNTVNGVSSLGGNYTTGRSGMCVESSIATTAESTNGGAYPFRLIDLYSNYAPGALATQPSQAVTSVINGADNTTVGQWVIVEPHAWASQTL